MLQVRIDARRGEFRLIADFATEAGTLCLFGRSGSGKTSLADAIAGLLKPKAGRIVLDGEVLFDSQARIDLAAWRRRIGYVFQAPRLFPHLDVRKNLLYGRREGAGGGVGGGGFDRAVGLLGLEALLDRRPASLSGGEARRVAIGRALAADPRLLILDEPTAGLDGARRAELLPYLESLRREAGIPLIYISHAVEEVTRLADAVVLMADGETVICAPPGEAFDHPEAEAAAGLTAPLSVLDGTMAEHDPAGGSSTAMIGPHRFLTPRLDLPVGERVRVVVDARDVAIALSEPKDVSIQNRLPVRVADLSPRNGGVLVRLEAQGLVLKALVTPEAVARLGLKPGLAVIALVKASAAARHL
jgi:molybdate transport system ATP-binding protein